MGILIDCFLNLTIIKIERNIINLLKNDDVLEINLKDGKYVLK